MTEVLEEAHAIAIALDKSVNMRATAAKRYADLCRYVHSPDTDGAQQMIDAGYEPTDRGVWEMLTADRSYPTAELGVGNATRKRLKFIGSQDDPEESDRAVRAKQAEYDRGRYNTAPSQSPNVTAVLEQIPEAPNERPNSDEAAAKAIVEFAEHGRPLLPGPLHPTREPARSPIVSGTMGGILRKSPSNVARKTVSRMRL
jgi:hypothetical protein